MATHQEITLNRIPTYRGFYCDNVNYFIVSTLETSQEVV